MAMLLTTPSLAAPPSSSPATQPGDPSHHVAWPLFGPAANQQDATGLQLQGHANQLPDFVGPIDGSARLTVFTEGNHFPVLLALVFEDFTRWSQAHNDGCHITPDEILVVTLPQVMVVQALIGQRVTLHNAVLPLHPAAGRVYPDWVMGGLKPLSRLAQADVVAPNATAFAMHRGLGMLLSTKRAPDVDTLQALAASDARIVIATPHEAGARMQYRRTLRELVGEPSTDALFARELSTFPGRLRIQHRDVPYALLTGQADAGLIFGHLACFHMFLLERAKTAYPAAGFANMDTFDFGRTTPLKVAATQADVQKAR